MTSCTKCIHKALDREVVFTFLCLAALSVLNRYWEIMIFVSALSETDIIRTISEDKIDGKCGTYEQVNVLIHPRCVFKS